MSGVSVYSPLGANVPIQLPKLSVFELPEGVQYSALIDDQAITVEPGP